MFLIFINANKVYISRKSISLRDIWGTKDQQTTYDIRQ